jgi:hypothetical protein
MDYSIQLISVGVLGRDGEEIAYLGVFGLVGALGRVAQLCDGWHGEAMDWNDI